MSRADDSILTAPAKGAAASHVVGGCSAERRALTLALAAAALRSQRRRSRLSRHPAVGHQRRPSCSHESIRCDLRLVYPKCERVQHGEKARHTKLNVKDTTTRGQRRRRAAPARRLRGARSRFYRSRCNPPSSRLGVVWMKPFMDATVFEREENDVWEGRQWRARGRGAALATSGVRSEGSAGGGERPLRPRCPLRAARCPLRC